LSLVDLSFIQYWRESCSLRRFSGGSWASTCKLLTGEVQKARGTRWLALCSEVQMTCIWSRLCHCHPIIPCFIKIQNGLTFLVPAYQGCPGKKATKWVFWCNISINDSYVINIRHLGCKKSLPLSPKILLWIKLRKEEQLTQIHLENGR